MLGIVNPDNFLGGRKKLDAYAAREAIDKVVATPLGMTVDDAAAAIYAIQNAQTADLVRKVVVNSGHDPREFTLYAFGGAGPMHCAAYSADLGVREVVVPLGSTAAVFSAYGLAASDIVLTAERSQPSPMPVDADTVNAVFGELEGELEARLAEQGLRFSAIRHEREADLRYTMQLAEVSTPARAGTLAQADVDALGRDFERRYEALYGQGTGFPDAGLQLITYRVRAVGTLPITPTLPDHARADAAPEPSGRREVFLDVHSGRAPATIYDYRALSTGHRIDGPAVVEAPTTTVALPPRTRATVDRLGNLVVRLPHRHTPTLEEVS